MRKLIPLILIICLFVIPSVMASTIVLDKSDYDPGETAQWQVTCSGNEKNQAYTVNITNGTGTQLELDTGDTGSCTDFFGTYIIPSNYISINGASLNVSLQGTNLEGTASATITVASENDLIISGTTVSDAWLGLDVGVSFLLKDDNDKRISGGYCDVHVHDNTNTFMKKEIRNLVPATGHVGTTFTLNYDAFEEGTDYVLATHCFCGSSGSDFECIDEDGLIVTNSTGRASFPFTTKTWVTFNDDDSIPIVYENGTDYPNAVVFANFDEKTYWLINVSNGRDEELEFRTDGFLINDLTKELLVIAPDRIDRPFSIPGGNSTTIASSTIPKAARTGVYIIRIFINVLFNNILVAQYIQDTETFNVTGTADTFKLENVATDRTNYYTGESMHLCVNVTNNFNRRVEFTTFFNIRCSTTGGDFDVERSIMAEHTELRGSNAGSSQYQCAELHLNFLDHLKYQTSQCYGSVTLQSPYISTFDNKLISVSNLFNVTDFGMYPDYELDPTNPIVRLFPDWRRFDNVIDSVDRSYYRTFVNITDLDESSIDPNGEINDDDWDIYVMMSDTMPCSQEIFNYTALDSSGAVVDNSIRNKDSQWIHKNNGDTEENNGCAIEIMDVNFSDTDDDFFEVRIWFEDFEERSTVAFEGINNKTGSFAFNIDAEASADSPGTIDVIVSALLELGDEDETEGWFSCYIAGHKATTEVQFTNAINKVTPFLTTKTLNVPAGLGGIQTAHCDLGFIALGNDKDSATDTFAINHAVGVHAGDQIGEDEDEDGLLDKIGDKIKDIKDKALDIIGDAIEDTISAPFWFWMILSGGLIFTGGLIFAFSRKKQT